MADPTTMGTLIAQEITTAEAALLGSETDPQIRLAMMIALSKGILPSIDSLNANVPTGTQTSGQYARVARVTASAQNQYASLTLAVNGAQDGGVAHAWAIVQFKVRQQAALGSPPIVDLDLVTAKRFIESNFVAVTTVNSGSETVVELYAQAAPGAATQATAASIIHTHGTADIDVAAAAAQAALPGGTQTPSVWAPVRNPIMLPDTATALQWVTSAWYIGSDVVYHAGNLPKDTANTPNTLVERDASGNFAATLVTADLAGNATTASAVANAATFDASGAGAAAGTTFDGSAARTVSHNTLGAAALVHTHVKADVTDFAHTHGNLSDVGAIGTTSDQVVVTGASGVLTTASRSGIDSRATFPIDASAVATLGTAQTFTAAKIFRATAPIRAERAATQDAVVLDGRTGGTSSYAVTLTPTTLTANRTITLPNAAGTVALTSDVAAVPGTNLTWTAGTTAGPVVNSSTGTGEAIPSAGVSASGAVTTAAQIFAGAKTFRAASAIRSEAASAQDAIVLAGRTGGSSSYAVTLTPATLSANRTITLPNAAGTVALTSDVDVVGGALGDYLPLTGGTLTGSLIVDAGSAYSAISVRRSEQSGVGQNDRALMDVMSSVGAARFLHYNGDTLTTTAEMRIYRGGEFLFMSGATEGARITSGGIGIGTSTLTNGSISIGYTGADTGLTFNGVTGGTFRIFGDGTDAYVGARGGTLTKGIKIDTNGVTYAQAGLETTSLTATAADALVLNHNAANVTMTMATSTYGAYIRHGATTGLMSLSGGNLSSNGANVLLYGGSHSTLANKGYLRVGSTQRLIWDSTGVTVTGQLIIPIV